MRQTYLVTGAAGFIGSAIARQLINQGNAVWTIDNLTTGHKNNIPIGAVFVHGNCQSTSTIKKLDNTKFDAILHFAGQSSGEISFDNPVSDLQTNTEATLQLIKYGLEKGCNRFIYASTMSVYGDVEDKPISESNETKPLSFYGVGKLASENYLRIYKAKGLIPTTLRLFNVYGPGQNMANLRQGMVSIFLAQLLKSNEIVVKGALDRFRDLIFIDDCVNFIVSIIDDDRSYYNTYNVGSGVKTTIKTLIEKMISISGEDKEIVISKGTPGDQKGIYADIDLIRHVFNFTNETNLDEGLAKMIKWARLENEL